MKTIDIQQNTDKLLQFTYNKFINGELDNNSLVQQIELLGSLLNLQTLPKYAKSNNLSYNGVKNHRNIIEIFEVKFVIDNE